MLSCLEDNFCFGKRVPKHIFGTGADRLPHNLGLYARGTMTLGRLERVDLREYFRNEASDFTPWLSGAHNIDLLADEIGIGIQNVQTEASVGRFNVDILAEEENTGRKIIIESG